MVENHTSKNPHPIAGTFALASIAVFTFPSCDSPTANLWNPKTRLPVCTESTSQKCASPKNFPLENFVVCIGEWQTLKDSVAAAIRQDTAVRPIPAHGKNVVITARPAAGTFRLALSKPHLQGSVELKRAVLSLCRRRGTTPFRRGDPPVFRSAGRRPAYRGNKGANAVGIS